MSEEADCETACRPGTTSQRASNEPAYALVVLLRVPSPARAKPAFSNPRALQALPFTRPGPPRRICTGKAQADGQRLKFARSFVAAGPAANAALSFPALA